MTSCPVCHLPIAEIPQSSSRECPFCPAVFSRVDGARRHAKCCPRRGNRALRNGKRGRKTKSCDQCSRVKVHCNAQNPCERCVSRQLDCTFSRYCTDTAHRPSPTVHEPTNSHDRTNHNRVSLSFLLNYTDENQDFVAEKAVGEEPDGTLLGPTGERLSPRPRRTQDASDIPVECINPTLLLPFNDGPTYLEPSGLGELYSTEEQNLLGAFLSEPLWSQEDRLIARLDLLELDIVAHTSSGDRYRGPPFDPPVFRQFFNASNVQNFAMLFCRKRHYRYPVIHWPTFVLQEASLPLLMVVALTGATYSYRPGHGPEHITEARKLYHLADSYVFYQLRTFLDRLPEAREADLTEAIQLCQASLLMYGLDTLLASDYTMQRLAMAERLPSLISAMRRLNFIACRHQQSEDWQSFIRREEVVRLVTWAFCVDCLATLSCNNPPIFSLLELSGDLPCDPALWDADSESAFVSSKSIQNRHEDKRCLKDLMSIFMDDEAEKNSDWEHLPFFHLHIIMCAFQPIIFNLHVTMSLPMQSEKLLRTFSRWRSLWDRGMERLPPDHRQYLGIARNIPDIEHLSRRIVEIAISTEDGSSRYLQRVPSYSASEIHEFMQNLAANSRL